MKQTFRYFITGEERRKQNRKNNLIVFLVEVIFLVVVGIFYIIHLYEDTSAQVRLSETMIMFSLALLLNSLLLLIRNKKEPFMKCWMYHHDITVENNVLYYVITNGENQFASSFPITKVKENTNGIYYYKDRFNYVFIPKRVIFQKEDNQNN